MVVTAVSAAVEVAGGVAVVADGRVGPGAASWQMSQLPAAATVPEGSEEPSRRLRSLTVE